MPIAVECWGTGLTEAWKEAGFSYAEPVTLVQNLTVVHKVLTEAVRASNITFAHFWIERAKDEVTEERQLWIAARVGEELMQVGGGFVIDRPWEGPVERLEKAYWWKCAKEDDAMGAAAMGGSQRLPLGVCMVVYDRCAYNGRVGWTGETRQGSQTA